MTSSRPRLLTLRTQLLSLLAIIITLCILFTWLVYTKLGLNQYFITNKEVNIPSWANSVFDEQISSIASSIEKSSSSIISPACKPHFKLALSNGNWSSTTKFKRLYFYHVRKAGVRSCYKKCAYDVLFFQVWCIYIYMHTNFLLIHIIMLKCICYVYAVLCTNFLYTSRVPIYEDTLTRLLNIMVYNSKL